MENTIPSGYEDLEKWSTQQNDLLSQQQNLQNQIVQQQTQKNIDELNYQKNKIDNQTNKTTSGLYTNYQKMANNYGIQAEQRAQMGLANSGYSETARVNLYNNYQRNVTETVNNANQLKADFDFQIAQARQTGDITLAQNQLALYQQKMQLLTQEYDMRNRANQFAYQQQRDTVADNQWQQSFDYNKERAGVQDRQWQQSFDYQKGRDQVQDNQWQQSFDYQKSRDEVADSQWERQFELSKKAYASSSRRSSSSRSSGNGGNGVEIGDSDANAEALAEEVKKNIGVITAPGSPNNGKFVDRSTGKIYDNPGEIYTAHGLTMD